MSGEWYDKPYPGGKMVPVPGFPRPLYPPDAEGKQASVNGPDVEAYKRVVWRAGRWKGPAANFDRAFSNGFSHGKGPNVIDSGVAGVQRQQNVDDTGWIGEKTFNTFRSIKIPAGLPHAGEMAMDVTAQNLIGEAWELFKGKEPPPPEPPGPVQSIREAALEGAIRHIGTKESPAESNQVLFSDWYGMIGPWCAMFVTYCFEVEAGGSPSFKKGSAYAYCPYVVSDARNQRNGLNVTSSPVPGDLVLYDWGWDGEHDHIGIFEKWLSGSQFSAIEGNTGSSNYSNGGEVMRCTRNKTGQGTVFVRVAE